MQRNPSVTESELVSRVQRFNYIRDFWRCQETLTPYPFTDVFQTTSVDSDQSSLKIVTPHHIRGRWPRPEVDRRLLRISQNKKATARHRSSPSPRWYDTRQTCDSVGVDTSDQQMCTCTTDICTSLEDLHDGLQAAVKRRLQSGYDKDSELHTVVESASCGFYSYMQKGDSKGVSGGGGRETGAVGEVGAGDGRDDDKDEVVEDEGLTSSATPEKYSTPPLPSLSSSFASSSPSAVWRRRVLLCVALVCVTYVAVSALANRFWVGGLADSGREAGSTSGSPSDPDPATESVLWMTIRDPDKSYSDTAGCDWDCLKLLFN